MTVSAEEQTYHELSAYTLTHGDATFIHQHVVDAWAAQNAHADSKPIGVFFALVGLYLHIEQEFTGREAYAENREPVIALLRRRGIIR